MAFAGVAGIGAGLAYMIRWVKECSQWGASLDYPVLLWLENWAVLWKLTGELKHLEIPWKVWSELSVLECHQQGCLYKLGVDPSSQGTRTPLPPVVELRGLKPTWAQSWAWTMNPQPHWAYKNWWMCSVVFYLHRTVTIRPSGVSKLSPSEKRVAC